MTPFYIRDTHYEADVFGDSYRAHLKTWNLDFVTRYEVLCRGDYRDGNWDQAVGGDLELRVWFVGGDEERLTANYENDVQDWFYFFLYFQDEGAMKKVKENMYLFTEEEKERRRQYEAELRDRRYRWEEAERQREIDERNKKENDQLLAWGLLPG